MLRLYARIVGLILVLLGLAGLVGVVGVSVATSFYHAAVGTFFAYLGFWQRDALVIRSVVSGMGVMLLLVKGVTISMPLFWGGAPFLGPMEVTCLVVGVLSILAAKYLSDDAPTAGA
ncbi:hypothetical protein GBA65_07280 [Rubrobacter marinus]|uniref:Uncharacterized protein n=1 Tax=Rubrobacter marinus TaxID=2653852 RepID=A0A6G8PW07_9ACTN|nr:hypothetical protein [Rubrobacter marinus]QIN78355.1 hypothetical protein GBA65_07280 [Rubrobacter marinus]